MDKAVDKHGLRPDPNAIKTLIKWKDHVKDIQLNQLHRICKVLKGICERFADKICRQLMHNK